MAAISASISASPGRVPRLCGIEYPDAVFGSAIQKSQCAVAQTDPAMKKASTRIIRVLPPPSTKSVPEAQPPPSCMPIPKTKAPTAEARPIGSTLPVAGMPISPPHCISGKVKRQLSPISSICALSPAPRRSRTIRRQAAVKPNEAW